ncbi:MAG TPA: hypothetical protein VFQ61_10670 [Polyangiaceae bacterium]|nr:hypothetical protein [Polyangiaceae bacterium]
MAELTTRTARVWLGEDDGLVHLQPLARREQTLDDAVENVQAVKSVCAGVVRPLLIHFEAATAQTPECRAHYLSDEATSAVSAVAIVTNSLLGRIVGNLMIGMHTRGAPVRLFDCTEKASAWLASYLPTVARVAGARR